MKKGSMSLAERCFHNRHGICHFLGNSLGECIGIQCQDWVCWDKTIRDMVNAKLREDKQINFCEHVDKYHLLLADITEPDMFEEVGEVKNENRLESQIEAK
jgi:hypothetical protein